MADSHALTFGETPTSDDKTWGLLAHLSVYVSAFFGPLVLWVLFKDKAPFVKYHAMQSVVLTVVCGVIAVMHFVVSMIPVIGCFAMLFYVFYIPAMLLPMWGAYKAYEGEWYGFPGISDLGR